MTATWRDGWPDTYWLKELRTIAYSAISSRTPRSFADYSAVPDAQRDQGEIAIRALLHPPDTSPGHSC